MRWLLPLLLLVATVVTPTQAYIPTAGVRTIDHAMTLDASHCDQSVFTTGSFYGITLPAATAVADGCDIEITNLSASRGRKITVPGMTNAGFVYAGCGISNICPLQSVKYTKGNGGWQMVRNPGAWRPTYFPTFYVSVTGDNTNDGLDPSAPLTLQFTCIARALIDQSANSGGGTASVKMAVGDYTAGSGQTNCLLIGNYGSSSSSLIFLKGDNSNPTGAKISSPNNGTAIFTKDLGEVGMSDFQVHAAAGASYAIGIFGAQYSVVDVNSNISIGCMGLGANTFQFGQFASLNINSIVAQAPNDCTTGVLVYLHTGGQISGTGGFSFPAGHTYAYTNAVFSNQAGNWDMRSITFTVDGTVTGYKFRNYSNGAYGAQTIPGYLYTNGRPPRTTFPGNLNEAFPLGFATDFSPLTPFAEIIGCGYSIGSRYWIQDSTATAWGDIIHGGGSNQVIGVCSSYGGGSLTVSER